MATRKTGVSGTQNRNAYELFIDKLDEVQRRAERIGSNLTDVCREANISRATPNRWRREIPNTLEALVKMEEYVAGLERKLKQELNANGD